MTELLYLRDCYLKEFTAKVVEASEHGVILDKTAFYPNGGGQPGDKGRLIAEDGREFEVKDTYKYDGRLIHAVPEGLRVGDEVKGFIDWDNRYRFMRFHTASHILSTLIHKETGARITGNQLGFEESRADFDVEDFDREKLTEYQDKVNAILSQDIPITIEFLSREKAETIPSLALLAKGLNPNVTEIRVINIPEVDYQACGGTHVANVKEIGQIEITKLKNKGANNRRVYFKLV